MDLMWYTMLRPLTAAQVKYRKNTGKKGVKIQKNTEKIQKNMTKYRIFTADKFRERGGASNISGFEIKVMTCSCHI